MRERPEDFDEGLLRPALKAWGIEAPALTYAPVGFGDFHWVAGDRFVTVADVRRRSYDSLRAALDTAAALRGEAGLEFVVAPWLGGPYSEPARDLVAGHARTVRRALEEFAHDG
ncbi:hypothetical protein ABZW11_05735 [Nonomuraea sp. NPDC004580]|uniref:hypothetical protein n=1 Tax=Nonomuraea sp. NPDC004580 TaxID=3154552 RepID=UPI0033AC3E1E